MFDGKIKKLKTIAIVDNMDYFVIPIHWIILSLIKKLAANTYSFVRNGDIVELAGLNNMTEIVEFNVSHNSFLKK